MRMHAGAGEEEEMSVKITLILFFLCVAAPGDLFHEIHTYKDEV